MALHIHPDIVPGLSPSTWEALLKIFSKMPQTGYNRSADFLERVLAWIRMLENNSLREFICKEAVRLGNCHWTLILPLFSAATCLPRDEKFIETWSRLASDLAASHIEVCETFLEETPKAIKRIEAEQLLAWGQHASKVLNMEPRMWKAAKAYLKTAPSVRCAIPMYRWHFFLQQAVRISRLNPSAAEAFIQFGTSICQSLSDVETARWVDAGLEKSLSTQKLIQYFNGTSIESLTIRNKLASHETLIDRIQLLSLICEANLGQPVQIQSNTSLSEVRDFTGGAATDGHTIYLPDSVASFGLFKLMALHQSMLLESAVWTGTYRESGLDANRIHLDADHRMLQRLPGLKNEMTRLMGTQLPASYPFETGKNLPLPLPWWGNLLPNFIKETHTTIQAIQKKAETYIDCPSTMVESMIAGMMARGQRDIEGLWEMLRITLNTTNFQPPDSCNLPEHYQKFYYEEWDKNLSSYKKDWCVVYQHQPDAQPNHFVDEVRYRLHGLILLIRHHFMKLKPENFRKYRAQSSGDELDIDALIQAIADKRAGSFLNENVYIRRDKSIRDVSVVFLLDTSDSTGGSVSGRRVIDIQKEAVVLMSEALDSLEDTYALFGFNSEGRFRVDMLTIKDFYEKNNDRVKHRLGNLEPNGLTRLGAAIRHATFRLNTLPSRVKLMVILTDGRPYDMDYGDMDYAISDTKKAIQEARRKKIHPFIITSDKEGASYLKKISPITQSIILPRIEMLPAMLPAIYKRLTL